jgi:hypothetical protein
MANRNNLELVGQCHQGSSEGTALGRIPAAEQGATSLASRALAQPGVEEIRRRKTVAPNRAPECRIGSS